MGDSPAKNLRWAGGESVCRTLEMRWLAVAAGLALSVYGFF